MINNTTHSVTNTIDARISNNNLIYWLLLLIICQHRAQIYLLRTKNYVTSCSQLPHSLVQQLPQLKELQVPPDKR